MKRRARLILGLTMLASVSTRAQSLAFDATTVGPPGSGAQDKLFMPAGAAPIAGVVVLHGCSGVGPHYLIWAARLAQWGYAARSVDSFRPRGFTEVCNRGRLVPAEVQARDAFDAARYLRMRPEILAQRIGVIGFSHGGWAVLKAVLAGVVRRAGRDALCSGGRLPPGLRSTRLAARNRHTDSDRRQRRLDSPSSLRALARSGANQWSYASAESLPRSGPRFRRASDTALLCRPLHRARACGSGRCAGRNPCLLRGATRISPEALTNCRL
jgi:hypothetical protein